MPKAGTKLKAVPSETNGSAIQALTEAEQKAKTERINLCIEEMNKVLNTHGCTLAVFVQLGQSARMLPEILNLPCSVSVVSK